MLRTGISSLFFVALFIGAAHAQGNCLEPYAPVIPDGATASEEAVLAAQAQVRAFIADSDSYQNCLGVYIRQMDEEATRKREPVDATLRASMIAQISANQREKELIGAEFNEAVRVFNAAHPDPAQ
ncbi:MAG: hypothetical protein RJB62_78 [Pseudomonadota bacterium]|jgi:hypothetical protein